MNSYIYLIQDGEFINTDVYKVGRTSQMGDTRSLSRIKSYNKDTIQKYLREVNNDKVIDIESDIFTRIGCLEIKKFFSDVSGGPITYFSPKEDFSLFKKFLLYDFRDGVVFFIFLNKYEARVSPPRLLDN